MYLSKVLLTGEQFRNPYQIHKALWESFVNTSEQTRDFLFRVEQRSTRQTQILMQSQRPPENEAKSLRLLASKCFDLKFSEGSQLRFLLAANPIKTIADEQGRTNNKGVVKKCRVPLIKEEEQITWLKRKLEKAALIKTVEIEKQLPLHFRKGGRPGKIQRYTFTGEMEVTDADSLIKLVELGVGPAKAFGCGLVSLARA